MTVEILCHASIGKHLIERLQGIEFNLITFKKYDQKEIASLISNSDILVSWLATHKIIDSGTKLKFIQCWGAGVDQINLELAKRKAIKVCNLSGSHANAVAEYTIGVILMWTRKFLFSNSLIRLGKWSFNDRLSLLSEELNGKVLGIIGYGRIGKQIADKAKAFGLKVLAIRRHHLVNRDENAKHIGCPNHLDRLLAKSDFITINLPLTKLTKGIIGEKEINLMKPSALVINTARAQLVDEKALLDALKEKRIAGAILDVFWKEPISSDSPFLGLDNTILTPHIAGYTEESRTRMLKLTAENIIRFSKGRKLLNVVSFERGY